MRRLLLVVLLAALGGLSEAQDFVRYYPPSGFTVGTGGSLTSTGPIIVPNGTAAAPSLAFAGDSTTGLFYTGSGRIEFAQSGVHQLRFSAGSVVMGSGGGVIWGATSSPASSGDLYILRDAANTLALRNSTNGQTFNLYETYTDGSNYSRLQFFWDGAVLNRYVLGARNAGTGTFRGFSIEALSTTIRTGTSSGTLATQWEFGSTGIIQPGANDLKDIGTAALNVREFYVSRSIQGSKNKALTDAAAAASFVRIAVPTNGFAAGRVIFTVTSTDGTNILVYQNSCEFSAADTAGAVTAGTPTCGTPSTAYKRANTLSCTITGAVSTTNYDLQASCTDNLAGTQTMSINYRLDMPQPNTVTPQ